MTTAQLDINHTDINHIAADLGMTPAKVCAHIRSAIDAGLLRVVSEDDETVTLEAVIPEETPA